jgi:hypothetical protein
VVEREVKAGCWVKTWCEDRKKGKQRCGLHRDLEQSSTATNNVTAVFYPGVI